MRSLLPLASLVPALVLAACAEHAGELEPPADVDAGALAPDAFAPSPDAGQPPGPEPTWHDAVVDIGNNGAGFRPPEVAYEGRFRHALRVVATTDEPFEVNDVAYGTYRPGWMTVFFKVRNVGTAVRCFVQLEGISYRDAAGAELPEDGGTPNAYAIGSVRRLGTITTGTCLAPQESAWVVHLAELTQTQLFAAREVRVTTTSTGPAPDAAEPLARVVPTRMQLTPTDVRVELVNRGTGPAKLATIDWLAFDREGRPLGWGYLMQPEPAATLAAGGSTVATQWPAWPLDVSLFAPVGGVVAASIVRVDYADPR